MGATDRKKLSDCFATWLIQMNIKKNFNLTILRYTSLVNRWSRNGEPLERPVTLFVYMQSIVEDYKPLSDQ